jgi:predicted MFS family arabinose efflux permease
MTVDSVARGAATTSAGSFTTQYKIYILILLFLAYVSNYTDRMILNVLLPQIKLEFGLSNTATGFLSGTVFALFYATLGVPIAMLADRWSRRNIIVISMTLWSVMTVLCGAATSFLNLVLARIGVGVGEAGGSPPSHSIISDLFSLKSRATALSIYSLAIPVGLVIGLSIGAWIAENYDWRYAFFAMGAPGVAIALLMFLTVREPPRGAADGHAQVGDTPSLGTVVKFMAGQRSLVQTFIGATLTTIVGYAGVTYWPTFMVTTHGLPLAEMGMFLSLVFGLASGAGTLAGGAIVDRLSRLDVRWMPRTVAIALAVSLPFGIAIYLTSNTTLVYILLGVPAFMGAVYLAPTFALTQSLVGVRMRALASGILLFVINIIGYGIGPILAGFITDLLEPTYGNHSIAYSLLIMSVFNVWAILHYWLAGNGLKEDLERATRGVDPDTFS